ncbi:MAG TPA: hypothetical protein VN641_19385 [Urbifossiella sp.]|nr:hypothetical protein [Urbifossiella sp.]
MIVPMARRGILQLRRTLLARVPNERGMHGVPVVRILPDECEMRFLLDSIIPHSAIRIPRYKKRRAG